MTFISIDGTKVYYKSQFSSFLISNSLICSLMYHYQSIECLWWIHINIYAFFIVLFPHYSINQFGWGRVFRVVFPIAILAIVSTGNVRIAANYTLWSITTALVHVATVVTTAGGSVSKVVGRTCVRNLGWFWSNLVSWICNFLEYNWKEVNRETGR